MTIIAGMRNSVYERAHYRWKEMRTHYYGILFDILIGFQVMKKNAQTRLLFFFAITPLKVVWIIEKLQIK